MSASGRRVPVCTVPAAAASLHAAGVAAASGGAGGPIAQPHEVAGMVCHYLHSEGFVRTLQTFHEEAALILARIDRSVTLKPLQAVLTEYMRLSIAESERRQEAQRVAERLEQGTRHAATTLMTLLDDYARLRSSVVARTGNEPPQYGVPSLATPPRARSKRPAGHANATPGNRVAPVDAPAGAQATPSKKRRLGSIHPSRGAPAVISTVESSHDGPYGVLADRGTHRLNGLSGQDAAAASGEHLGSSGGSDSRDSFDALFLGNDTRDVLGFDLNAFVGPDTADRMGDSFPLAAGIADAINQAFRDGGNVESDDVLQLLAKNKVVTEVLGSAIGAPSVRGAASGSGSGGASGSGSGGGSGSGSGSGGENGNGSGSNTGNGSGSGSRGGNGGAGGNGGHGRGSHGSGNEGGSGNGSGSRSRGGSGNGSGSGSGSMPSGTPGAALSDAGESAHKGSAPPPPAPDICSPPSDFLATLPFTPPGARVELPTSYFYLSAAQAAVIRHLRLGPLLPYAPHLPGWVPHRTVVRALGGQLELVDAAEAKWGRYVWASEFEHRHAPWDISEPTCSLGDRAFAGAEQLFHALKLGDPGGAAFSQHWQRFASATPEQAAALGKRVRARSDWAVAQEGAMATALGCKFKDARLRTLLLQTSNVPLVFVSADDTWGSAGANMLGKLVMQQRGEAAKAQQPATATTGASVNSGPATATAARSTPASKKPARSARAGLFKSPGIVSQWAGRQYATLQERHRPSKDSTTPGRASRRLDMSSPGSGGTPTGTAARREARGSPGGRKPESASPVVRVTQAGAEAGGDVPSPGPTDIPDDGDLEAFLSAVHGREGDAGSEDGEQVGSV